MFELFFEKIYSYDCKNEPYFLAFPLAKGTLSNLNGLSVTDENGVDMPIQAKTVSYWDDGSIKWVFMRSVADIPANRSAKYSCYTDRPSKARTDEAIKTDGLSIDTGAFSCTLSENSHKLFDSLCYNGCNINVSAPVLKTDEGDAVCKTDSWEFTESGPLCVIAKGLGSFTYKDKKTDCELQLTFYAGKPWFETAVRIINRSDEDLEIKGLFVKVTDKADKYCTGISNYTTKYTCGSSEPVYIKVDANYLKYESNEHNPEVFYGTFFGEYTNDKYGVCATVFQAQQNFPKAMEASKDGLKVFLVPEDECVYIKSGMARQQKIQFHLHSADMDIAEVNHRSTVYQMPNRPAISPEIFKNANVFENIFTESPDYKYELFIIGKADEHIRSYGMMNWGDAPDGGYTAQGRGSGKIVWTNNEYDFPHACTLMYARTGVRRYMDYALVAARHQIDVDVCHYSKDPLIYGGQYEHCAGHIDDKKVVCSHQWVEGLIDCYHLTGEKEYLDTAIGIGKNVKRLLEQPVFQKGGQANARETGWALRTFTALYIETNDKSWLDRCDWIVGHFKQWEEEYGLWLAPYTDNTAVRVVFMISIAVCSLIRYYRISPRPVIKDMVLRAVDDLIENARLDNGLFYYKELPSLKRLGNNPIIMEAITYAYELTGDIKYLKAGLPTFEYTHDIRPAAVSSFNKTITDDALILGGAGTKGFAQLMIPYTVFYTAASKEGLL